MHYLRLRGCCIKLLLLGMGTTSTIFGRYCAQQKTVSLTEKAQAQRCNQYLRSKVGVIQALGVMPIDDDCELPSQLGTPPKGSMDSAPLYTYAFPQAIGL